jgi:hypothetical protein
LDVAIRDEYGRKAQWNSYERVAKPKLDIIEGFARHGLSNTKIAERLKVSESAFSGWIQDHTELEEALMRGRDDVDLQVENALLKRALGFTAIEITKERKQTGTAPDGTPVYHLVPTKKVYKQIVPDVPAIEYWLENRMGSRWARNPVSQVDEDDANKNIESVAELLRNPVPTREVER